MIHVKNMTKSLEMANRQIEMEREQQKSYSLVYPMIYELPIDGY